MTLNLAGPCILCESFFFKVHSDIVVVVVYVECNGFRV